MGGIRSLENSALWKFPKKIRAPPNKVHWGLQFPETHEMLLINASCCVEVINLWPEVGFDKALQLPEHLSRCFQATCIVRGCLPGPS